MIGPFMADPPSSPGGDDSPFHAADFFLVKFGNIWGWSFILP